MAPYGAGPIPSGLTNTPRFANTVAPGLHIGSFYAAQDRESLRRAGVTHVLSVCTEGRALSYGKGMHHKVIPILDLPSEELYSKFPDMCHFIEGGRAAGGVLVHCQAGISRSATAVLAYLMRHFDEGFDAALSRLRRARPIVNPNFGFVRQLRRWEQERRRLMPDTHASPRAPEANGSPHAAVAGAPLEQRMQQLHLQAAAAAAPASALLRTAPAGGGPLAPTFSVQLGPAAGATLPGRPASSSLAVEARGMKWKPSSALPPAHGPITSLPLAPPASATLRALGRGAAVPAGPPPEPPAGTGNIAIVFQCPDGRRLQRRFQRQDPVQALYDFTEAYGYKQSDFVLIAKVPRRVFADRTMPLEKAGVLSSPTVFIERARRPS
eukprot:tig00001094_g6988.t1